MSHLPSLINLLLCLFPPLFNLPQGLMKTGGSASVQASLAKVKTEAERLDVMDKAAGILGELLYTDQLLSQIKEYRTIMLPVSRATCDVW